MIENSPKFLTIRETANRGILSEYALRLMLKSDNPPPHITINKKVMIRRKYMLAVRTYLLEMGLIDENAKSFQEIANELEKES